MSELHRLQARAWNASRDHQVMAGRARQLQRVACERVAVGLPPGRGVVYVDPAMVGTRRCGLLPCEFAELVYSAWLFGVRDSSCGVLLRLVGVRCCGDGLPWGPIRR